MYVCVDSFNTAFNDSCILTRPCVAIHSFIHSRTGASPAHPPRAAPMAVGSRSGPCSTVRARRRLRLRSLGTWTGSRHRRHWSGHAPGRTTAEGRENGRREGEKERREGGGRREGEKERRREGEKERRREGEKERRREGESHTLVYITWIFTVPYHNTQHNTHMRTLVPSSCLTFPHRL